MHDICSIIQTKVRDESSLISSLNQITTDKHKEKKADILEKELAPEDKFATYTFKWYGRIDIMKYLDEVSFIQKYEILSSYG